MCSLKCGTQVSLEVYNQPFREEGKNLMWRFDGLGLAGS